MKRAFLIIVLIALFGPNASISQDTTAEQRLFATGYLLLKKSNELSFIGSDLAQLRKKFKSIDELDDLQRCYISSIIENIALAEITCKHVSMLLGILPYVENDHKLEQYKIYDNHLKEDTLKRLYLSYQNTGSINTSLEEKEILYFADKAKNEMLMATKLIEEVIEILQSKGKAKE